LAASRFIQITKAYQALTDEVARRDWEKYGNPDGPQTTKVGIGLPRFLLEKDHNLFILIAFFFVLLFVVPMTFICYYQQTKNSSQWCDDRNFTISWLLHQRWHAHKKLQSSSQLVQKAGEC